MFAKVTSKSVINLITETKKLIHPYWIVFIKLLPSVNRCFYLEYNCYTLVIYWVVTVFDIKQSKTLDTTYNKILQVYHDSKYQYVLGLNNNNVHFKCYAEKYHIEKSCSCFIPLVPSWDKWANIYNISFSRNNSDTNMCDILVKIILSVYQVIIITYIHSITVKYKKNYHENVQYI